MATLGGTPFSFVAPALFKDIPIITLAVITTVVVIPVVIHYASPARLTDILGDAMAKAQTTFAEALEAGYLSYSEVDRFNNLKREVTAIKLETLRNSKSYWGSVWGFLKIRTFTVLLCIWKVHHFETDLKIQKENRAV
ncbi:hypothetical protein DFH06DRAFT_1481957 [Mycena polygramma]|nr:hypothetical protein DFH06DRAFT_1481957 [Mycena polygramma]